MDGFDDIDFDELDAHKPRELENCADQTAAHRLRNLMEELSEDHYAAGWLIGLEYRLFSAAYADEAFGDGLSHDERSQLITLSQRCQGWWTFELKTGRKFLPLDEWLKIYEERFRPR